MPDSAPGDRPTAHSVTNTPSLRTPRLLLEPLAVRHARGLYEGMLDAEVHRYVPHEPPRSLEELEATLRRRIAGSTDPDQVWYNWTPIVRATGEPIGNVQITLLRERTALLGYFLLRRWWRRGYAREACAAVIGWVRDVRVAHTVVAEIDTRNAASIKLVEALGFNLARVTKNVVLKGEPCDEACYELTLRA
jgi:ribosomal-protein-alanine N-acetyltransferase